MTWLTPIGFLGLIGLIVLLIIYLIKPNYQNKMISSTYVWKLSLKYRRKKIPINKLRNILLILAQILAICACSAILAQPHITSEENDEYIEKIVILDASVAMRSEIGGETRFERAITEIKKLADEVFENDSRLSVILASKEATFVVQRAGAENRAEVMEKLDLLADPSDYQCTYGSADMNAAVKLAEAVTEENPECEVLLYTGTTYVDSGNVQVKNVADINEWNASILNATARMVDNYYEFRIDVACYGKDADITLFCDLYGVNDGDETRSFALNVRCMGDEMQSVVLGRDEMTATEIIDVYSYDYAYVYVQESDSFSYDNTLYLYGGTKPVLRVQYYSSMPNPFFNGALMALRSQMGQDWDIDLTEVLPDEEYELEGFDLYVFEHEMPETMPTDGLVILANPDNAPNGSGIYLGNRVSYQNETFLQFGEESPLMNRIDAEKISVTQYTKITMHDNYTPLMYCGEDPVVLAKNEPNAKIVVMSFSLNMSNFAATHYFPLFMYNLLENYIPTTVEDHVFEIYDNVVLNSRGEDLAVQGPGINETFTEFPSQITVVQPGTYTTTQTPISGSEVVESFYVKIPAAECNTARTVDVLPNPYVEISEETFDIDLLTYFALALVLLLFAEWWLQSREYF